MTAEIKQIYSPDILNLEEYCPEDISNFSFYLELSVGARNQKGVEIFGITVCTPKWLLYNYKKEDTLFLRHYLLVFEYSYDRIIATLKKKIETLSADNWNELALKIGEIAIWEFEDYREK